MQFSQILRLHESREGETVVKTTIRTGSISEVNTYAEGAVVEPAGGLQRRNEATEVMIAITTKIVEIDQGSSRISHGTTRFKAIFIGRAWVCQSNRRTFTFSEADGYRHKQAKRGLLEKDGKRMKQGKRRSGRI